MDNNIIFKINNVIMEKVNTIKFMSFIMDKELKFSDHSEFTSTIYDRKKSNFSKA